MAKIARIDEKEHCPHHAYYDGDRCGHEGMEENSDSLCVGIDSKGCPLLDADEYDRALIVRGIEMLRDAYWNDVQPLGNVAGRLIQEVQDGRKG